MYRKVLIQAVSFVLAFLFMFSAMLISSQAGIEEQQGSDMPVDISTSAPIDIQGAAAIVAIHNQTGQVVIAENQDKPLNVAGLTRIAPMLMIAEAIDNGEFSTDTTVFVSTEAAKIPGPTAFIEANESISAKELYKSAIMITAGDAVYALIEAVFGSIDAFLPRLNERLRSLGVQATYDTPLGDNTDISASDLAKIGAVLANSQSFISYSAIYMDKVIHENGEETELVNPNRLIRDSIGCNGLATGSSSTAGYSGVFSVSRGDGEYVCVVIGAKNSQTRFDVARAGIEYVFAKYKAIKLATRGDVIREGVAVMGSTKKTADLVALHDLAILSVAENEKPQVVEADMPTQLFAPIEANVPVATIRYMNAENEVVGELQVGIADVLPKAGLGDYIMLVLFLWVQRQT